MITHSLILRECTPTSANKDIGGLEEEYDFCPREALLVNMETRETEVNTVRPVTTGAGSSEERLHSGLVKSQEAAWRKQLRVVHTLSVVWGLLH